jgi:hypothetical protein
MGKSAQFPLHVWLPDSMEGPTPISALIHAATMVTAGIFMVSRMSPLFELSDTALSFVIVIGAITTLFMALIAIVQTDIKRVVAYSTLSQLGYMTMALGASAYSVAIFHLMTHAFFKAVLFLGAGSVIIAMHHEQDMRKMGGLRKYMPITYATMLIGAIANAGLPPFAGFFSKDSIIEAVHLAQVPGAGFAYFCALAAVFVGGLYSFRLIFFTFHGEERFRHAPMTMDHGHGAHHDAHDDHGHHGPVEPHESPKVVTLPLVLLAIPAIGSGWLIGTILYGNWFGGAIVIAADAQGHGRHGGAVPRHLRHDAARRDDAAVLAGSGRRRHGLVPLHPASRPAGGDQAEAGLPGHDPRREIRLRPLQRLVLRRRRAPARSRPVEGRRPGADRRRHGQRLGRRGRLVRRPGPADPVRSHLPLRLRPCCSASSPSCCFGGPDAHPPRPDGMIKR